MPLSGPALPTDVEALQRLLLAREADLAQTRSDLAQAQARESDGSRGRCSGKGLREGVRRVKDRTVVPSATRSSSHAVATRSASSNSI